MKWLIPLSVTSLVKWLTAWQATLIVKWLLVLTILINVLIQALTRPDLISDLPKTLGRKMRACQVCKNVYGGSQNIYEVLQKCLWRFAKYSWRHNRGLQNVYDALQMFITVCKMLMKVCKKFTTICKMWRRFAKCLLRFGKCLWRFANCSWRFLKHSRAQISSLTRQRHSAYTAGVPGFKLTTMCRRHYTLADFYYPLLSF